MIYDADSSDGSWEIIEKYSFWLNFRERRIDRGQAHAINKGLARASGEIFQWVNSDDVLLKDALSAIGENSRSNIAIAGGVLHKTNQEHKINLNKNISPENIIKSLWNRPLIADKEFICDQPGIWLLTENIRKINGVEDNLHYIFDLDLFVRYFESFPEIAYLQQTLIYFRYHSASKTIGNNSKFYEEYKKNLIRWTSVLQKTGNRQLSLEVLKSIVREIELNLIIEQYNNIPNFFWSLILNFYLAIKFRRQRSIRFFGGRAKKIILKAARTHTSLE